MKCAQTIVYFGVASLCLGSAAAIFIFEIPVKTIVTYESDGSRLEQQIDLMGREHGREVYTFADGDEITTHYSHGEVIESIHRSPDGAIQRHEKESLTSGLKLIEQD